MSFQGTEIIDYLGDDEKGNRKFVILLPPEEKEYSTPVDEIQVAHDYVRFYGSCSFEMKKNDKGVYPYEPKHGAQNWIKSEASITIGIREFHDIVLPYLNSHEYLQKKHFEDRTQSEDDKYYEKYGLSKPRWKAGDKYPPYCFDAAVVKLRTEDGSILYHCRRVGEKLYDILSLSLYDSVRKHMRLYLSLWELRMEKEKEK